MTRCSGTNGWTRTGARRTLERRRARDLDSWQYASRSFLPSAVRTNTPSSADPSLLARLRPHLYMSIRRIMPTTPHDGLCLSSSSSLSLTTTPLLLDSLHITLYNTNHVRAIQLFCRLRGRRRAPPKQVSMYAVYVRFRGASRTPRLCASAPEATMRTSPIHHGPRPV